MTRPGISTATLAAAGVEHIDAVAAQQRYGASQPGLAIPYFNLDGTPVLHDGKPYGRLRLERPVGEKKYHQPQGSPVFPYFPPGLGKFCRAPDLVIVEGEFKALSLVDAGIPAIGISGFYGFQVQREKYFPLHISLVTALPALAPQRILFLGDSDTALNWQFADAAVKLVHAIGIKVALPRIPIGGPGKGVDDCRQALGESFPGWWAAVVASAESLDRDIPIDQLAARLVNREADAITKLNDADRQQAQRRVIKVAAMVGDAIVGQQLQELAFKVFGTKARAFVTAVKTERSETARAMANKVAWVEGMSAPDGRQQVVLPGLGRDLSAFAADVARVMKPRADWLNRSGVIQIVSRNPQTKRTSFERLDPTRAISSLESVIQTGTIQDDLFVELSMRSEVAAPLLVTDALVQALPRLDRILEVPIPIEKDGKITMPVPGLNREHNLWLAEDAPVVTAHKLEEAKLWLDWLLQDFPFATPQDRTHYLAYLLTPMIKGLLPRWNCRIPMFIYQANRQRAGKDYAAGIGGLLYEGEAREENPITRDTAELEKRVTAAFMAGWTRLHFSECAGHLDNTILQGLVTKADYSGRELSRSKMFTAPNEFLVSLSGKNDLTLSTDLAVRSRTINMEYFQEDANARKFTFPDLHGEVLKRRSDILSALYSLVRYWLDQGRPPGPTPFASFSQWAEVVGGILTVTGLGDPCLPQVSDILPLDTDTADMKALFEIMATAPGSHTCSEIVKVLQNRPDAGIFQYLDFTAIGDRGKFGKLLRRYIHRELGGVRLEYHHNPGKTERSTFHFRPLSPAVGVLGVLGVSPIPSCIENNIIL